MSTMHTAPTHGSHSEELTLVFARLQTSKSDMRMTHDAHLVSGAKCLYFYSIVFTELPVLSWLVIQFGFYYWHMSLQGRLL